MRLLRFLSRVGISRGFLGGGRAWTLIGALALTVRALKRLFGGTPQVAYSEELRPGESLIITNDRQARVVRTPS